MKITYLMLAIITIFLVIGAVSYFGDGGDDEYTEPEGYHGFDAVYEYTTSGSTKDDYASSLVAVHSAADMLYVQSSLEGYTLKSIGSRAFENCRSETIIIPDTVRSVSSETFEGCGAEEVLFLGGIPEGFEPCTSKVFTTDPGSDHGLLEIHSISINGCSLDYITWNGQAIITDVTGSGALTVPDELPDGSGISCKVTMVGCDAFRSSDCTDVVMPDYLGRICTRAFYGCDSLKSIVFPHGLESIEDEAFRHCAGLEDVDLGDVAFIGFEAFRDCHGFRDIVVPDTVSFLGGGAFYICSSAESVTVGAGLDSIPERAFGYCYELKDIRFKSSVDSLGPYSFHMCGNLESIDLPSVKTIGNSAFSECRLLKNITLDSLEEIGDSVFNNCRTLRELVFTEVLRDMGSKVFLDCRSLDAVYFEGPMPETDATFLGFKGTVYIKEEHEKSWEAYNGPKEIFRIR